MKFYQSKILSGIADGSINYMCNDTMRDHESMLLTWKIIEYFQPKSLMEIGFYKGKTLGIIAECTGKDSDIVSVEANYRHLDDFKLMFPENRIQYIEINSDRLQLTQKFDFISIDGDHSYSSVSKDVDKCLLLCHQNSILGVDDYLFHDGVHRTVIEKLLGQNSFVPLVCTEQQMFFHHESHLANDFLDEFLLKDITEFVNFTNIDFYGCPVCRIQIPNRAIATDPVIFQSILKFYNI